MAARRQDQSEPESTPGVASEQPTDSVTAEVQEKVDKETEQGFRGTEVDPVPNENYTVAGVTSGAPTPETDPALARQVRNDLDPR
jgi:hypothetical protein